MYHRPHGTHCLPAALLSQVPGRSRLLRDPGSFAPEDKGTRRSFSLIALVTNLTLASCNHTARVPTAVRATFDSLRLSLLSLPREQGGCYPRLVAGEIMTVFTNLPSELVSVLARLLSSGRCSESFDRLDTRQDTLIALSETSRNIRRAATPYLWGRVFLGIILNCLSCPYERCSALLQPGHAAQCFAHEVTIVISQRSGTLPADVVEDLDILLSDTLAILQRIITVRIELDSGRYQWPCTLRAITKMSLLTGLSASGIFTLRLSTDSTLPRVSCLRIDMAHGLCSLDFASFPALRKLSLSLEDSPAKSNWSQVEFRSCTWRTIEDLELKGYCNDSRTMCRELAMTLDVSASPAVCTSRLTNRTSSHHRAYCR